MARMSRRPRTINLLGACVFGVLGVLGGPLASACTAHLTGEPAHPPGEPAHPQSEPYRLADQDDRFLEDLSHRSFQFFWDQADPATGIIRDRARTDGSPNERSR